MNQKKRSRKTNGKQETQKAVNDMNENKRELTKDFQDEGIQEDSENLDVVAPEGNSFEFLTQPEESYVEVITYEKEVSQFKIPGESDSRKKEAAGRRKSRRSYASVVSESENEDQDQPARLLARRRLVFKEVHELPAISDRLKAVIFSDIYRRTYLLTDIVDGHSGYAV